MFIRSLSAALVLLLPFGAAADSPVYPGVGYDQPLRPQFHFSSLKNWLNDPNGMVFDGENYHLFFQHNPQSSSWGNMTWGHATSPDMVRWTQHPHALLPYTVDGVSGTIFSGTAVVDHNNSLGVQQGDTKTLAAFFTFATADSGKTPFFQSLAWSTDRGKTWTLHNEGRAVVPNQGFDREERDPKVFWHAPSGKWVMVLWVHRKDDKGPGRIRFFNSTNLRDWTMTSDLERDWAFECMDLFFAPVDGDPANTKAVLYDASFDYEIGAFDGSRFVSETPALRLSTGNYYAAQSFNDAPIGRTVTIGWMRGGPDSAKAYGTPHNQQMGFPCELTVHDTPDGLRLRAFPIKEIATLTKTSHTVGAGTLNPGRNLLDGLPKLDLVDLSIAFKPGSAEALVLDLPGTSVRYDIKKDALTHTGVDDKGGVRAVTTIEKVRPQDGNVRLRLLVDRLSLEAFAFDGQDFGAHYFDPRKGPEKQSIHTLGGDVEILSLTVNEMKSAWPGTP